MKPTSPRFPSRFPRLACALLALGALTACDKGMQWPQLPYSNDTRVADSVKTCSATPSLTLIIDNRVGALSPVLQLFQDEFTIGYPKLLCYLAGGQAAQPSVRLILEEFPAGDTRAAYATGNEVHYSAAWLRAQPLDRGVLTHELVHVVQGYGAPQVESWVVEGMADYLRYLYTPINPAWMLPMIVEPTTTYTDGYRITARFFLWLERVKSPGIVRALHDSIQAGTYRTASTFFQARTGLTVDELWAQYAQAGTF